MAGASPPEPGERRPASARPARELAQPPSQRYRPTATGDPPPGRVRAVVTRPLILALSFAIGGLVAIVAVGGILASTTGLVFIAGIMGAGVGLELARAHSPNDGGPPAMTRRTVSVVALAIAIGTVALAAVALWLFARGEGGVLGPIAYLFDTFGPLTVLVPVAAALGAAWGAAKGPIIA